MQPKSELVSVRVDPALKANAANVLAQYGLSLSDAFRMLLARISAENQLPQGLTMNKAEYDAWFRSKVHEAMASSEPTHEHEDVMAEMQTIIDRKRHA